MDRLRLSWKANIYYLSVFAFFLTIAYYLVWPYSPIIIHSIEIVNPANTVYLGEDMVYEITYTKAVAYPVIKLTRQLVDGFVFTIASNKGTSLPCGVELKKRIAVHIPKEFYPGIFYLHVSATYQVNHLRQITIVQDSNEFEIKHRFAPVQ